MRSYRQNNGGFIGVEGKMRGKNKSTNGKTYMNTILNYFRAYRINYTWFYIISDLFISLKSSKYIRLSRIQIEFDTKVHEFTFRVFVLVS